MLPKPPVIPSHNKTYPQRLPIGDLSIQSRRTEPLPSPYGTSTTVMGTVTQWSPTPTPSTQAFSRIYTDEPAQEDFATGGPLTPSRTWTTGMPNQLQVPRGNNRERSNSQPAYSNHAPTSLDVVMKRRSASNLGERPEDLHGLR
jgi:hypothetical protein